MESEGHVGTNSIHYGCIDLASNARIYWNAVSGPESNPEDVIIMRGNAEIFGEMEWNSNSQFWGSVYVPRADVHFNSNADFYGSISAKSFDCDSNSKIHYDLALAALALDGADGTPYTVKSWQVKISQ